MLLSGYWRQGLTEASGLFYLMMLGGSSKWSVDKPHQELKTIVVLSRMTSGIAVHQWTQEQVKVYERAVTTTSQLQNTVWLQYQKLVHKQYLENVVNVVSVKSDAFVIQCNGCNKWSLRKTPELLDFHVEIGGLTDPSYSNSLVWTKRPWICLVSNCQKQSSQCGGWRCCKWEVWPCWETPGSYDQS